MRNCRRDVIRRLVAKNVAKQFMTRFVDATKPVQHALSTRGCESIAHVVQVMTQIAQCSQSMVLELSTWCPGGP